MKKFKIHYIHHFLISIILILVTGNCQMENWKNQRQENSRGVIANNAMVVSAHPLATEVGVEILKTGSYFQAAPAMVSGCS